MIAANSRPDDFRLEKAMFKSLCGSAGSAVGFAGGLYFHTERGSGGPHRLDERLHPEDGDRPLQIVGENVKTHLNSHLKTSLRQLVST